MRSVRLVKLARLQALVALRRASRWSIPVALVVGYILTRVFKVTFERFDASFGHDRAVFLVLLLAGTLWAVFSGIRIFLRDSDFVHEVDVVLQLANRPDLHFSSRMLAEWTSAMALVTLAAIYTFNIELGASNAQILFATGLFALTLATYASLFRVVVSRLRSNRSLYRRLATALGLVLGSVGVGISIATEAFLAASTSQQASIIDNTQLVPPFWPASVAVLQNGATRPTVFVALAVVQILLLVKLTHVVENRSPGVEAAAGAIRTPNFATRPLFLAVFLYSLKALKDATDEWPELMRVSPALGISLIHLDSNIGDTIPLHLVISSAVAALIVGSCSNLLGGTSGLLGIPGLSLGSTRAYVAGRVLTRLLPLGILLFVGFSISAAITGDFAVFPQVAWALIYGSFVGIPIAIAISVRWPTDLTSSEKVLQSQALRSVAIIATFGTTFFTGSLLNALGVWVTLVVLVALPIWWAVVGWMSRFTRAFTPDLFLLGSDTAG